jgi:hypothetical protein
MLDDSLKRLIDRELGEIHMLLERSDTLLQVDTDSEPTFERLAALSLVLISFYTGLERIFERVARRIDHSLPQGERWHTDLLLQVARPTDARSALISEETRLLLREYLAFRHHSRHAYAHHLAWSRMKDLVLQVSDTWDRVRSEIRRFIEDRRQLDDQEEGT